MEFQSHYNRQNFLIGREEVNVGPSVTIPDQTMSVQEIMKRYARGLTVMGQEGVFNGDEQFIPDLTRMDLSEIEDLKISLAAEIGAMQQELQDKAKKQAFLSNQKAMEQKFEEYKRAEELKRRALPSPERPVSEEPIP